MESELHEKDKKIGDLEETLQYLQDMLNDNNNDGKEVIVFDEKSKQYTRIELNLLLLFLQTNS